jgi:hypothetical protein
MNDLGEFSALFSDLWSLREIIRVSVAVQPRKFNGNSMSRNMDIVLGLRYSGRDHSSVAGGESGCKTGIEGGG